MFHTFDQFTKNSYSCVRSRELTASKSTQQIYSYWIQHDFDLGLYSSISVLWAVDHRTSWLYSQK